MEPGAIAMGGADEPVAAAEDVTAGLASLRPRLLRLALALGSRPEDAEDAVQEALLAAHRNRGRFDPGAGSLEAWTASILLRRMRNMRRTWLRRVRALALLNRQPARLLESPESAVHARLALARLLGALTPRQREVVALYEIAGLSAEETARVVGLTAAGVRSIARDARRALGVAASSAAGEEVPR